jgi:hypothetical protein
LGLLTVVFVLSAGRAFAGPPATQGQPRDERVWAGVAFSVVNDEASKRVVVAKDGYAGVIDVELGVRISGRISVGIEG